MTQLVERSLPTSEIRGSNPLIGKMLSTNLSTHCIIEKSKIKKKRPGMAHLFNLIVMSIEFSGRNSAICVLIYDHKRLIA